MICSLVLILTVLFQLFNELKKKQVRIIIVRGQLLSADNCPLSVVRLFDKTQFLFL
jgi:hypothetical protein